MANHRLLSNSSITIIGATSNTSNTIKHTLLEEKINLITDGLLPFFKTVLTTRFSSQNANTVCDYIIANRRENNVGTHTIRTKIQTLVNFSEFIGVGKQFRKASDKITKKDVQVFLDHYRKDERADPLHKWIGSYNLKRIILIQFFKWLYDPNNLEPRNRKTPDVVAGIKQYKRKEESIYKPTDLWTEEDDLLFLKYCDSPRDRCYHTVARDTACRPSELLSVKISQIDFKTLGNGRQYASIVVNGKTGNREVVLTNSLPYLKDWLNVHPLKGNPDAYLFLSQSDKNLNKQLTETGLFHIYRCYKLERFPRVLQQEKDISETDKQHIHQLLKKPFNPYLRRHIGLTQRAKQIHEYELRQYSGWSKNSKMHLRYIHWFNNQASNAVLKAEGFVSDQDSEVEKLKPVYYCSNCNEANIKNAKWCTKCGMVLSFSGYQEALKEQRYKDEKINVIEQQLEAQSNQLKALISALGNINDQSQVNQMAQALYSSGILNVSSSSKNASKK